MKESEDKIWKDEILNDFEKPTHAGFNDDVMSMIEELENKPVVKPAPLISARQWFFTALIASVIVILGVFVQYKVDLDLGFIEVYSTKVMQWINTNLMILWTALALVSVFFVISLIGQSKMIIK